jgi:hypothetical protein
LTCGEEGLKVSSPLCDELTTVRSFASQSVLSLKSRPLCCSQLAKVVSQK